jgi:hypothetical protein
MAVLRKSMRLLAMPEQLTGAIVGPSRRGNDTPRKGESVMMRELTMEEIGFVAGGEGTEASSSSDGGGGVGADAFAGILNAMFGISTALAAAPSAANCPNGGSSVNINVGANASGIRGFLGALNITFDYNTVTCNPVTVNVPSGTTVATMESTAAAAGLSTAELAALEIQAQAEIANGTVFR